MHHGAWHPLNDSKRRVLPAGPVPPPKLQVNRVFVPAEKVQGQTFLSKAMQWFGTCFTRALNMNNQKSGHLFQGRFKSINFGGHHTQFKSTVCK